MSEVEIRWRPSGGRGEYEHVPSDIIMDRRVVISHPGLHDGLIVTDVHGRLRDGKPRIRRDNPNDHDTLNIHSLMAALALLPPPVRTDPGKLILPLQADSYVVSAIAFHAEADGPETAVCTPLRLQVLHDTSTIDLFGRLIQVGKLVQRTDLPPKAADFAARYRAIVSSGVPSSELVDVAGGLSEWLAETPDASSELDQPSHEIAPELHVPPPPEQVKLPEIAVDETKRRLVSHYKLERDRGIRRAKVKQFRQEHGDVFCENCGFSFSEHYGDLGAGIIEVHHKRPLATLLPNTMTTLSDLMLLCANCHRVVHRKALPLTPEELKNTTKLAK
jgi:5-methylcytosine-specific restriction protein A